MTSLSVTPLVSVVIPNYNGAALLEGCLKSLMLQTYSSMEIIVVDNASRDHSVELVRQLLPGAVLLVQKQNLGFAGGANAGARAAKGEWIAVLNNDAEVAEDWLAECVAAVNRHPQAAFLACRILCFENRNIVYSAGDCFLRAGIGYRRGQELPDCDDYRKDIEIFSACGCAALYRKSAFDAAGGYDECFFAYFEDVDLCLRMRTLGYRGFYVAGAKAYHRGGATSGGEFSPLAVRLRTRNSVLTLIKNLPVQILWRCTPMVLLAQLSWKSRVLANGRLLSYLRGLAGILWLLPEMLHKRKQLRRHWKRLPERLWKSILYSESLAREDYMLHPRGQGSTFLKWYFRMF
jgi:GT2 family glycosyltransferase